jgi:hypothetical protein
VTRAQRVQPQTAHPEEDAPSAVTRLAMPDLSLTITINSASLQSLKAGGYRLYAMIAVSSSNKSGRPLIALSSDRYLANTSVGLGRDTEVYISQSPLADNKTVRVASSSPVSTGQMVTINTDGTISVSASGLPTTILIYNQVGGELTSGLSRMVSDASTPVAGFDTAQGDTITVAPLDQMFLFFATSNYTPGTVLTVSLGQGVLVDFGAAPPTPAIAYDVAAGGWVKGNAAWAKIYPPGTALAPVLVVPPGTNVPRRRGAEVASPEFGIERIIG